MTNASYPPTPEEEGEFSSALRDKRIRTMMREWREHYDMPSPQPRPARPPHWVWRVLRVANVALAYAVVAVILDATLPVVIVLTVLGGISAGIFLNAWYEGDL